MNNVIFMTTDEPRNNIIYRCYPKIASKEHISTEKDTQRLKKQTKV